MDVHSEKVPRFHLRVKTTQHSRSASKISIKLILMPAQATQKRLSALFDALMDFRSSSPSAEAWGQLQVYLIIEPDYSDTFIIDEYRFSPHTVLEAINRKRKPGIGEARSSANYRIERKGGRTLGYVEGTDREMYGSEVRRMLETLRNPFSSD